MFLEENHEYLQVSRALSELVAALTHLDIAILCSDATLTDARAAVVKGKRQLELRKAEILANHYQLLEKHGML